MSKKQEGSQVSMSHDTNQTREVGMMTIKSDYDRIVMDKFAEMESNPEKFDRCVRKVKAKGGVRNAYAVCNASLGDG